MRVTCWPRCCLMVRSEGDLCVISSTTSSDHKLWLVKRTSHLCKVNVKLWFFHILSGVFSLWLRREQTVFYVMCDVDVGRAKGNLWQPNHKRWFYVWREWYWNEASSDHLGKLTPEKSRSLLDRSDEIWSRGLATLVLCKILCPHNRPVYCLICHWYRHIWWLYRTVLPLVALRRAAHIISILSF